MTFILLRTFFFLPKPFCKNSFCQNPVSHMLKTLRWVISFSYNSIIWNSEYRFSKMALHLKFLFQVIQDLFEFLMWSDESLVTSRDHHLLPTLQRLDLSLYFQYPKMTVHTEFTIMMYSRMLIINSLRLINIIQNTVFKHKTLFCIQIKLS